MFVVANHFKVRKGEGDYLVERFGRPKAVATMPGFISLELLRCTEHEEYDEYIARTTWENREAHANWMQSEQFAAAHQNRSNRGAILESRITRHDVLARVTPAPASPLDKAQ